MPYIYQQYHTASIALQKELLNEFKQNKQQLETHGIDQSDTKSLIHKNIIKKVLNHEWNIYTTLLNSSCTKLNSTPTNMQSL